MDHQKQWKDFLNPIVLKERLINISMYITIYEMLKDSIINRIKDFYIMPFVDCTNGEDKKMYAEKVLSRNKNHLYASIHWMLENKIIDENDKQVIEELKAYRNQLAHEMDIVVYNGQDEKLVVNFIKAYEMIHKIEYWWIVNFELEINPLENVAYEEIDFKAIRSGKTIMIDMMLNIISGDEIKE